MSSNTLDERGRAVLEAVAAEDRVALERLETAVDASRGELDDRLAQLVDNALVREVEVGEDDGNAGDGEGSIAYELTENGVRVLNATPIGVRDHRIDTPVEVERAVEGFSLRPDEEEAVRNAFAFLRYWGDATTAEIVDAAYSEESAGYETGDRWWDECVSDRLEALPGVRVDSSDSNGAESSSGSIPELWRYEGTAIVDQPDDADGRDVADPTGSPPPFASVRHALEKLALSDEERTAARVAFAVLFDRETATAEELAERAVDELPAGFDSSEALAGRLSECFADLPNVEEVDARGTAAWSYRP
ncbi:hypothetical protein ACFQGT_14030 [Natrialbaceae archaeon GCM10025810]|uniref:hypothetical protein n=1 Tax=Halovalidus salilacus TaxID=3075124 RepID=UPI00361B8888